MKNRFFDEEGLPEDLYHDMDRDDEMYDEGEYPPDHHYHDPDRDDEIHVAIEMERREINQKVLFRTIRSLERSWWWRFSTQNYKTRTIRETYQQFQRLIALGEYRHVDYREDD